MGLEFERTGTSSHHLDEKVLGKGPQISEYGFKDLQYVRSTSLCIQYICFVSYFVSSDHKVDHVVPLRNLRTKSKSNRWY